MLPHETAFSGQGTSLNRAVTSIMERRSDPGRRPGVCKIHSRLAASYIISAPCPRFRSLRVGSARVRRYLLGAAISRPHQEGGWTSKVMGCMTQAGDPFVTSQGRNSHDGLLGSYLRDTLRSAEISINSCRVNPDSILFSFSQPLFLLST